MPSKIGASIHPHTPPVTNPPYVLGRAARAQQVLDRLRDVIPQPDTELRYDDVYQLLIAVILSAQCTDERVNMVTPALFEAFPTVEDLAEANPDDIYPYIQSVTFPNNKAGYLAKMARRVVNEYGGTIPTTQKELETLSGVGRKTAQVVINVAHDAEALPVDTHVFRVANRIGLVKEDADTPLKVEQQLKRIIPRADWGDAHHLLILHGRYTCTARSPSCDECPLTDLCKHYQRLQRLPEPVDGLDASQGRYYCQTDNHYFDEPATHIDRHGIEQVACPWSGSMNVFDARTGQPTKQIPDYRVNGEATATAGKE